jgi:hypothetical protein
VIGQCGRHCAQTTQIALGRFTVKSAEVLIGVIRHTISIALLTAKFGRMCLCLPTTNLSNYVAARELVAIFI